VSDLFPSCAMLLGRSYASSAFCHSPTCLLTHAKYQLTLTCFTRLLARLFPAFQRHTLYAMNRVACISTATGFRLAAKVRVLVCKANGSLQRGRKKGRLSESEPVCTLPHLRYRKTHYHHGCYDKQLLDDNKIHAVIIKVEGAQVNLFVGQYNAINA
jgi:hypothetical protein